LPRFGRRLSCLWKSAWTGSLTCARRTLDRVEHAETLA